MTNMTCTHCKRPAYATSTLDGAIRYLCTACQCIYAARGRAPYLYRAGAACKAVQGPGTDRASS